MTLSMQTPTTLGRVLFFLAWSTFLCSPIVAQSSPIQFTLEKLPFHLENDETPGKNAPEAMAGGVAVFDSPISLSPTMHRSIASFTRRETSSRKSAFRLASL
jgi:hypothetical protein